MKRIGTATCIVFALTTAAFAQDSAVVNAAAPVFLFPDANRTPLRTLPANTAVRVMEEQGAWLKVEFRDPQLGARVGYIETKHVRNFAKAPTPTSSSTQANGTPASVNSAPATTVTSPATPAHAARQPEPILLPTAPAAREARRFPNAQLTVPDGEKTKQADVTIAYAADVLQFVDDHTRKVIKEFPYKSFTGGEYSYSKSPRWKSGVFISPFLFLSSGKKHWLLVKTAEDYAMLRLDKNNYKLIIAEWETKTGLKVEAEGENK